MRFWNSMQDYDADAMDESGQTAPACLNCDGGLQPEDRFCPNCGQRCGVGRLRLREIGEHFFAEVLSWDSKYARTIVGLVRRPGEVCAEYVAGRRTRYVNPLKFCLTIAALFFLLNAVIGVDLTKPQWGIQIEDGPTMESGDVLPEEASEGQRRLEHAQELLSRHIDLAVFFALPIKAVALWLLFRRSRRNLAESVALTLFLTGLVYLLMMPLSVLGLVLPEVLHALGSTLEVGYFAWAAQTFYGARLAWSIAGSILALMIKILGIGIPILIAIAVYVMG